MDDKLSKIKEIQGCCESYFKSERFKKIDIQFREKISNMTTEQIISNLKRNRKKLMDDTNEKKRNLEREVGKEIKLLKRHIFG